MKIVAKDGNEPKQPSAAERADVHFWKPGQNCSHTKVSLVDLFAFQGAKDRHSSLLGEDICHRSNAGRKIQANQGFP